MLANIKQLEIYRGTIVIDIIYVLSKCVRILCTNLTCTSGVFFFTLRGEEGVPIFLRFGKYPRISFGFEIPQHL